MCISLLLISYINSLGFITFLWSYVEKVFRIFVQMHTLTVSFGKIIQKLMISMLQTNQPNYIAIYMHESQRTSSCNADKRDESNDNKRSISIYTCINPEDNLMLFWLIFVKMSNRKNLFFE